MAVESCAIPPFRILTKQVKEVTSLETLEAKYRTQVGVTANSGQPIEGKDVVGSAPSPAVQIGLF